MNARPGHKIARTNKGHPRRQARRDRARERACCDYVAWPVEMVGGVRWHIGPVDEYDIEGPQRVPCGLTS